MSFRSCSTCCAARCPSSGLVPCCHGKRSCSSERYQKRFLVKPGISGLWQVSGRSRLSMREALELDIEYAVRQSLALDLSIIVRTVPAIFGGGAR